MYNYTYVPDIIFMTYYVQCIHYRQIRDILLVLYLDLEATCGAGAQGVTVNETGCEFDEMKYLLKNYISITSLWCRGKALR